MFEEQYEKLATMERENFRRMVNYLLAHTYLLADEYDFDEDMRRTNRDYLFVERNFSLFQEYLSYAGFRLEKDVNYGVISIESEFEGSRLQMDKMTTLMIYALRLMYEEEREKLQLLTEVFTTVGGLVGKLLTLGAITKKPSNAQLSKSLRLLRQFNIIRKVDGKWEDPETRVLILPSILFIVTNEQISNMNRLIDEDGAETGKENIEDDDEESDETSAD